MEWEKRPVLYFLDFWHFANIFSLCFDRPVGMPKMEKVYLHNPSSEETITLVSISATTSHFHASFFQNRVSFLTFSKLPFLPPQIWMEASLKEWLTEMITYLEILRYFNSSHIKANLNWAQKQITPDYIGNVYYNWWFNSRSPLLLKWVHFLRALTETDCSYTFSEYSKSREVC